MFLFKSESSYFFLMLRFMLNLESPTSQSFSFYFNFGQNHETGLPLKPVSNINLRIFPEKIQSFEEMSKDHHHHKPEHEHGHSHDAPFVQVDVKDEVIKGHFDLVVPLCDDYHKGKFKPVHLQHAYAKKNGKHDWFYWAQVQVGEFGNQHNWTVVFEIKDHHAILDSIHEGHKTFF